MDVPLYTTIVISIIDILPLMQISESIKETLGHKVVNVIIALSYKPTHDIKSINEKFEPHRFHEKQILRRWCSVSRFQTKQKHFIEEHGKNKKNIQKCFQSERHLFDT